MFRANHRRGTTQSFDRSDANGSSLDELSTVSICVTVAVKSYEDARISSCVPATAATTED